MPSAAAFVLTQADLIQDLDEEFEVGEYTAVQFRVGELEARTGLDFGPFRQWDVLEQEGAEESYAGFDDSDYAVINDFSATEDVILLAGSAQEYSLGSVSNELASGTGIYYGDELIAIAAGTTMSDFSSGTRFSRASVGPGSVNPVNWAG